MNDQNHPHNNIARPVTPDNGNQVLIELLHDNTALLLDSMNNKITLWRNIVNSVFNYNQNMNQYQADVINYVLHQLQEIENRVNVGIQQFLNVTLHSLDDVIQLNRNIIVIELHVRNMFTNINTIMINNNILITPHEILPLGGGKKYKRTQSKKTRIKKKSNFTIKK
jgi:hypothetical protein